MNRNSAMRLAGLLAGPLAAVARLLIPSGLHAVPGMGHRPAAAAAVAAWMALWWFTEAVPMAWTALLPLVLFPALGVFGTGGVPASLGRAALPYVDPYIFLFLGGMVEAGEGRRLEHFGAALMLGVAYGANVGGIGTKHMCSSEQTLRTPLLLS